MYVDRSIRRLTVEEIEQAFAAALEKLTGHSCEVRIHNLYVPPGGMGAITMKFGRPGLSTEWDGEVGDR